MGRDVELGPYLRFKRKYLEGILAGKKRVTVRYGIVRPRFSLVYIVCCDQIYGEAIITKVYYTRLDRVGQDVIEAEGFGSREELVSELKEIYGEVRDGDTVSVIFFSLVRKYDKPVPLARLGEGV
ncbi:ASCH domain-containing protein [Pyrobaculum aerophilum]|uniref:ASCH domain-containing protein n=1 Tax=Pyrobaculum aerophilum TaxID=13773 RepID=A0A371R2B4_9CREN|nr:ASCH domain-containing protein [Pyrobaculum aerophilum]RFA97674.1 ASCH domain-containing protein [Pyrobaculum aerophilum]RFA99485.1 ASCH domain-containing protein [Pyrobaculum aerophilum]